MIENGSLKVVIPSLLHSRQNGNRLSPPTVPTEPQPPRVQFYLLDLSDIPFLKQKFREWFEEKTESRQTDK